MTEQPTGSAIQARREQVQAFQRPQRLNEGVNIRDEVAGVRETADLFKVYRREWIIVFTSKAPGEEGQAEAEAYFAQKYAERVRDEDVRYDPASTISPDEFPRRLLLNLPNTKGEFKYRELAEAYCAEQGWPLDSVQIVARNSRDEYVIKDYGLKKLPKVRP